MPEIRDQGVKPSHYLTSAEVASRVGVSPRTVSNWIRDGHLKAYRTPGGHSRIAEADLQSFLDERGIRPLPETVGSQPRPAPIERPRVLFIDDDENLLDIIREVLEANGFEVQTARHG